MMFNKFLEVIQEKTSFLYENSLFLQNIDKFILPFILMTYIASTFMNSDTIGIFALVVMFLTFVKILTTPNEKLDFNLCEIFLILYFMIVIVSLCGSTLFEQSLKGFFKTFVYIGFYFSVANYLKTNLNKIPVLLGAIALCTFGEGLVGLFQSTLHLEQISTWQDTSNLNPEDVLSRVYGTLKPLNPNLYGGYLVAGLPLVIGSIFYFLSQKNIKLLVGAILAGLTVVFAILQTGCRGAYLSTILIFGAIFMVSAKFLWKTFKKWYIALVCSAVGLFFAMLTFVSSLRLRFLSIFAMRNDSSNSFRFNVYQSSLQMFKDNWLLGIGVGNKNFREIYGLYMKTGFDALSSYNIYLETAVESGIFALITFLLSLFVLSYESVKFIFRNTDVKLIIYVASCIVAVWAVMFHGLVDTIYFRPQLQFIFWTYVAVLNTCVKNLHKFEKSVQ